MVSVGADTRFVCDHSEKALRHAIRLCCDAQVKFETSSAFGRVAETINKIAREVRADQIVMGTGGFIPLCGAVFGSTKSGDSGFVSVAVST